MAKFGSYFGLCPLIDHRSLLGVSRDYEDDKVLVTLGKNIAMQYRLSDQKQIISWTTKEKFTSPVIYDVESQKYVAVFNQMYLRSWSLQDNNLDKVKKLKFKSKIDTLISAGDSTFILFQNGSIVKLGKAISMHKTLEIEDVLNDNEYVCNILSCCFKTSVFIGLLVRNDSNTHLYVSEFDSNRDCINNLKIRLHRDLCALIGCIFHVSDEKVELLTLWSDGKLCLQNIEPKLDTFSVIESISTQDPVSMVSLDKDYIAIYGTNSNQEGALLIIYNMQFKVTQCKQPFKLVTIGAKLFAIDDKLFVPVGQNLAVIPYFLEKEQLSSLIGSHKLNQNKENKDVIIVQNVEEVNWSNKTETENNVEVEWEKLGKDYLDQGCPESEIFQQLSNECMEKNNVASLEILIKMFIDIPDKNFIDVLRYFINASKKIFKSKPHTDENYPENLQPYKRYELISLMLQKSINEISLLPYLRSMLDLDTILKLLNFIVFSLVNNELDVTSRNQMIQWISLILDANFQIFRLSKDENVLKILLSLSEIVESELTCLDEWEKLLSILKHMNRQKKVDRNVCNNNNRYVVERIEL